MARCYIIQLRPWCVCVCVYTRSRYGIHIPSIIQTHMLTEARGQHWVSFLVVQHLSFLWQDLAFNLELTITLDFLRSEFYKQASLCPAMLLRLQTFAVPCLFFFWNGTWESEFRSIRCSKSPSATEETWDTWPAWDTWDPVLKKKIK